MRSSETACIYVKQVLNTQKLSNAVRDPTNRLRDTWRLGDWRRDLLLLAY